MRFQLIVKTPLGEYLSKMMDEDDPDGRQLLENAKQQDGAEFATISTVDGRLVIIPGGVLQQSILEIVLQNSRAAVEED